MEVRVPLTQHSPLLQFQWAQRGAILRASEFKPRFDTFIRVQTGKSAAARLDYRMTITGTVQRQDEPGRNEPFFGNMRAEDGAGHRKVEASNLVVSFSSFSRESLDLIVRYLNPFLATTNFGASAGKAYGCFYPENEPRSDFESTLKAAVNPLSVFAWPASTGNPLQEIRTAHSLLKSGINLRDRNGKTTYYKSQLFLYCKTKGITWDKKALKERFLAGAISDPYSTANKYFVRGLLGTSESQDWYTHGKRLSIKSSTFDRVPSSLLYKIFRDGQNSWIYIFTSKLFEQVLGSDFRFEMAPGGSMTLPTPKSFDMNEYLTAAIANLNKIDVNNLGEQTQEPVRSADRIIGGIKGRITVI